jgi:hypothetical protein
MLATNLGRRSIDSYAVTLPTMMTLTRHFACRGIPCLCIHDSFVVPLENEAELYAVMVASYRNRIGFDPELKRAWEPLVPTVGAAARSERLRICRSRPHSARNDTCKP